MLLNIHNIAMNENVTNQFDVRYEFNLNLSNSNIVLQTCFTNDEMVDIDNYFHNLSSSTINGNHNYDDNTNTTTTTTHPTITTSNSTTATTTTNNVHTNCSTVTTPHSTSMQESNNLIMPDVIPHFNFQSSSSNGCNIPPVTTGTSSSSTTTTVLSNSSPMDTSYSIQYFNNPSANNFVERVFNFDPNQVSNNNQTSNSSSTSLSNQYHSTTSISNNTPPIQNNVSNKISKELKQTKQSNLKRTFNIPSVESSPQPSSSSSSISSTRLSMKNSPSLKKKSMKSTMRGNTSSQSFSKESPWQFHTYSEGKRQDCDNLVFFHFKPNQ